MASLGGGKGQSSFYMAGSGFLVIFFEPELPNFSPPLRILLHLADAAFVLHQNQPGMRREITMGNLMHISFSFDVGLAWFLALSELPRLQKFQKMSPQGHHLVKAENADS